MEVTPLPCPFCGESGAEPDTDSFAEGEYSCAVWCGSCHACGPGTYGKTPKDAVRAAIIAWNQAMEPRTPVVTVVDGPTVTRAEAAEQLGLTIQEIFQYERAGLLSPLLTEAKGTRRVYLASQVDGIGGISRTMRRARSRLSPT